MLRLCLRCELHDNGYVSNVRQCASMCFCVIIKYVTNWINCWASDFRFTVNVVWPTVTHIRIVSWAILFVARSASYHYPNQCWYIKIQQFLFTKMNLTEASPNGAYFVSVSVWLNDIVTISIDWHMSLNDVIVLWQGTVFLNGTRSLSNQTTLDTAFWSGNP